MNTATTQARFWFSPSRNRLTWREPSEAIYPLTEPCDWRPLVVIDPEDDDAAHRLADEFYAACDSTPGDPHRYVAMQAALREFANPKPPRIDEPGTLGVVEASCVHGDWRTQWIHHEDGNWYPFGHEGMSTTENPDDWDSLVDPVLVRDGVRDA